MAYISKRTGEEVDALLDKVEKGDFSITVDSELSKDSDNAIANSTVTKALKSKVEQSEFTRTVSSISTSIALKPDKDGYYPEMSVGMADNLVGRGDVQDAQINFRPSAGTDNITDGVARIEKIKGNSVVYNQYARLAPTRTLNGLEFINQNGELRVRGTVTTAFNYDTVTLTEYSSQGLVRDGRKYLIGIDAPAGVSFGINGYPIFYPEPYIFSDVSDSVFFGYISIKVKLGETIDYVFKKPQITDLTKMFGAGNEPTTVEEYLLRKPIYIEDEFAYNEGKLIDMKVDALISISDNAYDYENGYARVMGGVPYTITVDNRNDITPEEVVFATKAEELADDVIYPNADGTYTFPSDGYANASFQGYEIGKEDTICICLKHSYEKPHSPYQREITDLSFISEAFPEGMRSAGSVFDEIRFNPTIQRWEKVVRVGVREYVDGDTENSSVTTDGETTNYPLNNPTPTFIPLSLNLNLDYPVWDFGTEEAMASVSSAPFRADINYEPNAVDDLRWAVAEIRNLKAQLAQKSASVTNLAE